MIKPSLFLLLNHDLTPEQEAEARTSFDVNRIVNPPPQINALWKQLPAGVKQLAPLLTPVREWLATVAIPGDIVLIHGDFGACYLIASFARDQGLMPIYSSTERHAVDEYHDDGSVQTVHRFLHVLFRRYGE